MCTRCAEGSSRWGLRRRLVLCTRFWRPLLLRFSAIRGGRALAVMRAYRLTRFGLLLGWWELSVARRRSDMTKLRFMTDLARGRLGGRLLLAVVSIF